jgi:hypothetical protein
MKAYLDMCALKRPFDDQSQSRIWMETQAVMRILGAFSAGGIELCSSAALVFENQRNPNPQRRARAATLLASFGDARKATDPIFARADDLRNMGFRDLDALHIAFAENENADYFVTADDGILKRRDQVNVGIKILDPIELVTELDL